MTQENKQHTDADFSFEAVPKKARKGFLPMFFIMLGFTIVES